MPEEAQSPPLRDVRRKPQAADDVKATGAEAVKKAAQRGSNLSDEEADAATEWLLSEDPAVAPEATRKLTINVGTADEPNEIPWVIRAIDGVVLREIQRSTNNPRAIRRGGGEPDQMEVHARTVVAGTVLPDLAAASRKAAEGRNQTAKATHVFLAQRFEHKPGLIPQIAAEIMQLSGFDDTDVRETVGGGVQAAEAGGKG
jgi:hypothetical protein